MERYTQLNAEFQRRARRDRKAFLSDQCKEKNNRMGKTRDLFKKIRETRETYMQIRKQQLELDMEQQTGSKWEKEYAKVVYCHPAYLTSMQSTS